MNDLTYKSLYKEESFGKLGVFGIEILVAGTNLLNLKEDKISNATYKAVNLIKSELLALFIAQDPSSIKYAIIQKKEIISCFKQPIFVKEIPNKYCSDYCCRHLPWFIVTTSIGHFTIGWRKRVIHIDYSETLCDKYAQELFSAEDVTKGDKYIHAWSIDKAKEYINKIISNTLK